MDFFNRAPKSKTLENPLPYQAIKEDIASKVDGAGVPLERLKYMGLHIKMLKGSERKELETAYDAKAAELFEKEIEVPKKTANSGYEPASRLKAITSMIDKYPFMDSKTRNELLKKAEIKRKEVASW